MFRVGKVEIEPVASSCFRLDGGSMFGFIPRTLWERKAPPDERNRIRLNVNSLFVKVGDERILVEPGMGLKYDDAARDIYALREMDARGALLGIGIDPAEISLVIATHLHFDHAGGSTFWGEGGNATPSFPGAKFMVQAREWEEALNPHPLAKGSYIPDDCLPLEKAGLLKLVDGDEEVREGVFVQLTGGHTAGHEIVRIRSDGEELIYLGDLVPTSYHLRLNWLMAWDMFPQETYAQKKKYLEEACERGSTVIFSHDPDLFGGRLNAVPGGYELVGETVIRLHPR